MPTVPTNALQPRQLFAIAALFASSRRCPSERDVLLTPLEDRWQKWSDKDCPCRLLAVCSGDGIGPCCVRELRADDEAPPTISTEPPPQPSTNCTAGDLEELGACIAWASSAEQATSGLLRRLLREGTAAADQERLLLSGRRAIMAAARVAYARALQMDAAGEHERADDIAAALSELHAAHRRRARAEQQHGASSSSKPGLFLHVSKSGGTSFLALAEQVMCMACSNTHPVHACTRACS